MTATYSKAQKDKALDGLGAWVRISFWFCVSSGLFLTRDQRSELPPRIVHHTKAFKIPDVEVEERSLMTYEVVW